MRQDIFNRYETITGKRLAIDVSIGRIEELYEDFDSAASYVKKDLDQDFVDYLIECAREVSGYEFVIRINLPTPVQEKHCKRVRKSIKGYFRYLELLQRRKLRRMLWRSFLLFCLGMFLLTISLNLRGSTEHFSTMMQELLVEGLTVAAWVSLWTAFAGLIFELAGIISDIRIYRRIAGLDVLFESRSFSRKFQAGSTKADKKVTAENLAKT